MNLKTADANFENIPINLLDLNRDGGIFFKLFLF